MEQTKQADLPVGCFSYIDHGRILRKDINNDRPMGQRNISTECVIGHGVRIEKRIRLFRPNYWSVFATTTYELCGDYANTDYMGGLCWTETDYNGLEWKFKTEKDAQVFAFNP